MIDTNKLHLGDNLDIMKSLPTESIDLIYADPPFNTGKNWGEFDDRWDSLQDYLDFMTTRIKEIHRLLKPTGSFYLHCDPTSSHYLKVEVDKVFHIKNFRNEIVWRKYGGHKNTSKRKFTTEHDSIFFYTFSEEYQFNTIYRPLLENIIQSEYKHIDENGKLYSIPRGRKYRQGIIKRKYLDTNKGVSVGNLWTEKELTIQGKDNERVNYPTQKPIALLDRIIQASSDVGDIILDPFCGSGTALVSANQLGRYYIGIDENPKAIQITEDRLKQLNLFTI